MKTSNIKTFTSKYINDAMTLSGAVVGFEFEFYTDYSWAKLMELLNIKLSPAKVWSSLKYHSDIEVDGYNFKIEPDYSGGPNMVELITGPTAYNDAKIILLQVMNFIQEYCYTDEKCSVHVNISFDEKMDKSMSGLNPLKLILETDEDYIYSLFPERRNNIYAKSVKRVLPFKGFTDPDIAVEQLCNNLILPDDTKYYGINLFSANRGWIEYRYIGGKDYQNKTNNILELMDYFIISTYNSIKVPFDAEDKIKLKAMINDKINKYKLFNNYDNFLTLSYKVDLQVDQDDTYEYITSYYEKFREQLYDLLVDNDISNGLINYNTENSKLEIVGCDIKSLFDMKNVHVIDCTLNQSYLFECQLIRCEVFKSHVMNSKIIEGTLKNCKITSCNVIDTEVKDSYMFMCKFNNNVVESSILRACEIDENSEISTDTLSNKDAEFWFKNDNDKKKKKKL